MKIIRLVGTDGEWIATVAGIEVREAGPIRLFLPNGTDVYGQVDTNPSVVSMLAEIGDARTGTETAPPERSAEA